MTDSLVINAKRELWAALASYGNQLTNLPDAEVPDAYSTAVKLLDLSDELKEKLRIRMLDFAQQNTTPSPKGSYTAAMGEQMVRLIPTRTGYDPKKVEMLLRMLGLDPNTHMLPTLTYKVDKEKLEQLVANGTLAQDALDETRYEPAYRVQVAHRQETDGIGDE